MLVEQCLREGKDFTFPGLTKKGCSIFNGGTLLVKNAEVQYNSNGMACGIILNKTALALRLNLKMEYCVGEVKTPLEGLSTILVDLKNIDGMTSAEIASLVCHGGFVEKAIDESKRFSEFYKNIADEKGCVFFDAAKYIPFRYGLLHLEPEAHEILAKEFFNVVKNIG